MLDCGRAFTAAVQVPTPSPTSTPTEVPVYIRTCFVMTAIMQKHFEFTLRKGHVVVVRAVLVRAVLVRAVLICAVLVSAGACWC